MIVYFRTINGESLVEKGKILTIGGAKRDCILTGNDKMSLEVIGNYETKEEAQELFDAIIAKIVNPTLQEMQKGFIYIDLQHLVKLMGGKE